MIDMLLLLRAGDDISSARPLFLVAVFGLFRSRFEANMRTRRSPGPPSARHRNSTMFVRSAPGSTRLIGCRPNPRPPGWSRSLPGDAAPSSFGDSQERPPEQSLQRDAGHTPSLSYDVSGRLEALNGIREHNSPQDGESARPAEERQSYTSRDAGRRRVFDVQGRSALREGLESVILRAQSRERSRLRLRNNNDEETVRPRNEVSDRSLRFPVARPTVSQDVSLPLTAAQRRRTRRRRARSRDRRERANARRRQLDSYRP